MHKINVPDGVEECHTPLDDRNKAEKAGWAGGREVGAEDNDDGPREETDGASGVKNCPNDGKSQQVGGLNG